MGFFGDFFSGDWGNAFNVNELKPGGWIPDEINNPTGALTALAGGLLLGPAVGTVLAPLAGAAGSAVGGALGSVGLGGVSSALGSLAGSTLGSTAIGLGTKALASNAIGGLLGGAKPNPQAIGVGTLAAGAPTYDKTLLDAFNAQLAIEPQKLAANQLYQPEWAKLSGDIQAELARRQMQLQAELQPGASGLQAAYLNAARKNEIGQLQSTLPQYQQAIQGLTPGYAQAINTTGQLAQQSMQRALQTPQLTAFEDQVGSPYRTPAPQQAGNFSGQMPQQPQGPPPVSAMQSVSSQLLGQQPQGQQGPGPAGQPQGQPMGPQSLQQTPAGGYVGQVQQFQPANVQAMAGMPQEVGYLNQVANAQQVAALAGNVPGMSNLDAAQSAQMAAAQAGEVPTARSLSSVRGPQLASNLQNINQGTVNQYLSAMPGMQDYARMLAQQSQGELAAGRSLTPEEQRLADQSARSAYAARGTALGNQAIGAEILNRADVANQRYQQRLQNSAQAANTIQNIYQPALAQSLQRQQAGLQYGLEAQGQAFGQARDRDVLNQQLQAQRYGQAMGTQAAGFGQAQNKDTMAAQLQQQRYNQLTGSQETAFSQAGARENVAQQIQQQRYGQTMGQQELLQGAQGKAFEQAMGREGLAAGTQQTAFNQALQRGQSQQQRLQAGTSLQAGQAQLGAGALSQLQTAQAPIMNAYFQQPILSQAANQAGTMGLANQAASGNTLFNPESPMAFQSAFLPYQSNIALQQSQMTANAAKQSGQNSMFGSIGGSIIGALPGLLALCWVAREVYGTKTSTWKMFRTWLLNEAPEWLVRAYIKHGPDIAEFIKDKPVLKSIIRKWMDSKIQSYIAA